MDVDEWPCKKQSVGGTHRRVIKKNKMFYFRICAYDIKKPDIGL